MESSNFVDKPNLSKEMEEIRMEVARLAKVNAELKSQLELRNNSNSTGESFKVLNDTNLNVSKEKEELEILRKQIEELKAAMAPVNSMSGFQEWEGELDLNHPGIPVFAKTLHKKFKDFYLPGDWNFVVPAGKGGELYELKILWTNLCTVIKIILNEAEKTQDLNEFQFNLLGLTLNMCVILAEKRDLAVVKANTDEETAKLFKSMRGASNFMLGNNRSFMEQAISMREAQVRIGVNVPRQRQNWDHNNNNNSYQQRPSRGRGGFQNSRGRGGHNSQGGQQYHQQVQNYSSPAPQSGPGAKD
jgi:hypothetical protein